MPTNDDMSRPIHTNADPFTTSAAQSKVDTGAGKAPGVPEPHRLPNGTSLERGAYRGDSDAAHRGNTIETLDEFHKSNPYPTKRYKQ